MLNLILAGASHVFPADRRLKLIRSSVLVINFVSPYIVTKNVILTIIGFCIFVPLRLTAHYLDASSLVITSVVTLNPLTIDSAVYVIGEIYENY